MVILNFFFSELQGRFCLEEFPRLHVPTQASPEMFRAATAARVPKGSAKGLPDCLKTKQQLTKGGDTSYLQSVDQLQQRDCLPARLEFFGRFPKENHQKSNWDFQHVARPAFMSRAVFQLARPL